jgi:hypothetical protein
MVQMSVGQHHRIKLLGIERKGFPIQQAKVFVALEQAAIDQQLSATCSDKCLGSGHGASRTKKLEIHVTASNKNRAVIMICLRVLPRIFARLLDAAYRGKPWQPSRRGWGKGAAAPFSLARSPISLW